MIIHYVRNKGNLQIECQGEVWYPEENKPNISELDDFEMTGEEEDED